MPAMLQTLRDILLFRRGPQDMPYSPQLLTSCAALCVILQLAAALPRDQSTGTIVIGVALWLVFILGMLWIMLRLRGLANRFVQAATTLLACHLVFTLISLPIALAVGEPPTAGQALNGTQLLLGFISLPLVVWKLSVDAHVLRHSLDIPFFAGLVIALLWIVGAMALAGLAGAPVG